MLFQLNIRISVLSLEHSNLGWKSTSKATPKTNLPVKRHTLFNLNFMLEVTCEKPLDPGRTLRIPDFTVQFLNRTIFKKYKSIHRSVQSGRLENYLLWHFSRSCISGCHQPWGWAILLKIINATFGSARNCPIISKISFVFPLLIHTQPSCFVIEFSEAMTRNGLTWITKHTPCPPTLLDTILRGHNRHTHTP